jgi:hypothetical protein
MSFKSGNKKIKGSKQDSPNQLRSLLPEEKNLVKLCFRIFNRKTSNSYLPTCKNRQWDYNEPIFFIEGLIVKLGGRRGHDRMLVGFTIT